MSDDGYPVFAPDGSIRQIPDAQMQAALASGGKMAMPMIDPQGTKRYIPSDQVQNAMKAGGKPANDAQGMSQWEAFKSLMPGAAQLFHAAGLPANPEEAAQAGEAESKKSFGQHLLETSPIPAAKMLGGVAASMGKELVRGAKGAFTGDPYAPLHVASGLDPFAAPAVSQMTEQGLGTPEANATGMVGAGALAAGEVAKVGGKLAQRGAEAGSERMYQSALKPSLAKNAPSPSVLSKTGLEAGIPVSADGQVKLQSLIENLNDTISGKIKAGTQAGATIDPADIANRLDALKAKFSKQALPAEDLQTIEDAKQAFLKAHPSAIPLDEAQAIKQGTYQQLKGKYGQLSSARMESEKALARGIKEELQTQFPEIQNLNAQEGRLINLDGALERAVRRIGNHQLMGIGTPIVAGAVGGTAGGPAGVMAGVLKAVIDDPVVKSKMAIALNKAGRGAIPVGVATSRIGLYSRALAQPQQQEQQ